MGSKSIWKKIQGEIRLNPSLSYWIRQKKRDTKNTEAIEKHMTQVRSHGRESWNSETKERMRRFNRENQEHRQFLIDSNHRSEMNIQRIQHLKKTFPIGTLRWMLAGLRAYLRYRRMRKNRKK